MSNGDGLLFITPAGQVGGIKVNRVDERGQLLLARRESIPEGSEVYRNYDQAFERLLAARVRQKQRRQRQSRH